MGDDSNESDRGAYVVYGQHRGLVFTGEVSHVRSATGREHREEVYESFDANPYRLIHREGTRHRRFPKLRLSENRVNESRLGKSRITMVYDDLWAYQTMRFSRYPRGLVETGSSLQSGSFTVKMNASSGIWISQAEFSVTVHYYAPTKKYRYYSGLPHSETRSAGAPPRLFNVEILKVDVGQTGAILARYGFNTSMINPPFRWRRTGSRSGESGGFWTQEEEWAQMMDPWYVCYITGGDGGQQKDGAGDTAYWE
ncbi:MAG TPA: hypothetical protein PLU30_17945 [Verrucomicrobiae bacterium]|nr:hypothetical protein [Verrucomicrobiae bacterium]